jgi:hypothetical protein
VAVGVPVERTLFYSTFFARERALKLHVASLMLHTARAHAAACGWAQVYAGLRKQGREAGVDEFYLQQARHAGVSAGWRDDLGPARRRVARFGGDSSQGITDSPQCAFRWRPDSRDATFL